MQIQKPEDFLSQTITEYKAIPPPKYLNITYADWNERYRTLIGLKNYFEGNRTYRDLMNALSQILPRIAKLSSPGKWKNISERGINKALPVLARKGKTSIDFPYQCRDKTGYDCYIANGYWGARNYMVMDVLGYIFLLKEGGDILPKKASGIFRSTEEVSKRESGFSRHVGDPVQSPEIRVASSNEIEAITACENSIRFGDKDFRRFVGLKLSSNEILEMIHQTSRVEFKLRYPVRLKGKDGKLQEHYYMMNFFSRLFELGYREENISQNDEAVRRRVYLIAFDTMLGELFIHNLKAKNYNPIPNNFYFLPESAQLFHRKFLVNNNYSNISLKLSTIARDLNLRDKNVTNLKATIVNTIFTPLKKFGVIKAFEVQDGLDGAKYVISRQPEGM